MGDRACERGKARAAGRSIPRREPTYFGVTPIETVDARWQAGWNDSHGPGFIILRGGIAECGEENGSANSALSPRGGLTTRWADHRTMRPDWSRNAVVRSTRRLPPSPESWARARASAVHVWR